MPRLPLSKRNDPEAREKYLILRDGIPESLAPSVFRFLRGLLFGAARYGGWLPKVELVEAAERSLDRRLPRDVEGLADLVSSYPSVTLDLLDFLLSRYKVTHTPPPDVVTLYGYLDEARSVWTVGEGADGHFELQKRQGDELTDTMAEAMSVSDRASEHVRVAWSKAFGREADTDGACIEATKAIEVVGKPVVSPDNGRTTLGTMIRDMRSKPEKWTTDSEADNDVLHVVGMMEMVWQGHYRHGDESTPVSVSEEGAIMAVNLAVVLVQWFRSGYVRRAG
jgi:hypothetical protein